MGKFFALGGHTSAGNSPESPVKSSEHLPKQDSPLTFLLRMVLLATLSAAALSAEVGSPAPDADEVSWHKIPKTLEALAADARLLEEKIAKLPAIGPIKQFDAYGYHGGYLPALDKLPEKPRWTVEVEYLPGAPLRQVILVPAAERRFQGQLSYGFPKRFRLSKVFPDGTVEAFAEWMDEDCPIRGRMPVIVEIPEPFAGTIRMDVFRGAQDTGRELFALDEFYCVANNDISHALSVNVSSEFQSLPYWSREFIADQKTSLGLPLGIRQETEKTTAGPTDFSTRFDPETTREITFELDLGSNQLIHEMLMIPAAYSDGVLIPGFGFPRKISVSTFKESDTGERVPLMREWLGVTNANPGQNVLRLRNRVMQVRWVQVTFSDFFVNGNEGVFSMGEIIPRYRKTSYPVKSIRLLDGPPISRETMSTLVDRKAAGRPVMFFLDWIQQVNERNHLSLLLEHNEVVSSELEQRWSNLWWLWGTIAVVLLVLTAISITSYSVFQRGKHALALRRQITSDLHDDIGSSMSAVSLALRRLRRLSDDGQIHERCSKIDSILGNMQNAFQDVLWFTNSDTDSLRQMLRKLIHMTELYVPEDLLHLTCTSLDEIPDRKLKVMFKRDLLLVFREALNNSVKHSGATEIHVTFHYRRNQLTLTISDNGKGFDLEEVEESQDNRPHLGLNSMQRRINRLNAKADLQSAPGKGTTLQLLLQV